MSQLQTLLDRLSNIFTRDSISNLSQLLGTVGNQLDQVDPAQTNLEQQFAVSTATESALDSHGMDWGIPRKPYEADSDYRKRIQALVPIYTNGPTVAAMNQIIHNFTGVDPIILEYGPDSFTMGVSPMGSFVFGSYDPFTFQVQVQNPNNVLYKRADLEAAVNQAKPARSTALFVHQGGV
jgi:hypothetical protein